VNCKEIEVREVPPVLETRSAIVSTTDPPKEEPVPIQFTGVESTYEADDGPVSA
jgi:hypothetical protein